MAGGQAGAFQLDDLSHRSRPAIRLRRYAHCRAEWHHGNHHLVHGVQPMRRQHVGGAITSIDPDSVKQFGIAYDIHLWLRGLTWLTIASAAYLLVRISGGFPPRVWRLLLQTAPQGPHLYGMRGTAILLPLLALVTLSLTCLALEGVLLWPVLAIVRHSSHCSTVQAPTPHQQT